MKFKSWLATLIIGSNVVLPCKHAYSLRTTEDFMEASRLTAEKMKEQPEDMNRFSLLYELLLQMFAYVAFCEHKGLDPEIFLWGVRTLLATETLKKKDVLSTVPCKTSDKFKLSRLLPKEINLDTATKLILDILEASPDNFELMFLVNPGHTADDITSALAMCGILRTSVVKVQ